MVKSFTTSPTTSSVSLSDSNIKSSKLESTSTLIEGSNVSLEISIVPSESLFPIVSTNLTSLFLQWS